MSRRKMNRLERLLLKRMSYRDRDLCPHLLQQRRQGGRPLMALAYGEELHRWSCLVCATLGALSYRLRLEAGLIESEQDCCDLCELPITGQYRAMTVRCAALLVAVLGVCAPCFERWNVWNPIEAMPSPTLCYWCGFTLTDDKVEIIQPVHNPWRPDLDGVVPMSAWLCGTCVRDWQNFMGGPMYITAGGPL